MLMDAATPMARTTMNARIRSPTRRSASPGSVRTIARMRISRVPRRRSDGLELLLQGVGGEVHGVDGDGLVGGGRPHDDDRGPVVGQPNS